MDDSPSTDVEALVARLRAGDEEALADLFARYRSQLQRMVRFRLDRRLQARVDASDVVQDAYLDAAQRVRHFIAKPHLTFLAWLRMITGQRLIDLHRQHLGAKLRSASLEVSSRKGAYADATSVCIAQELLGDITSPSQKAMRGELSTRLAAVLEEMEPVDREVIALRHFEELTNAEVADALGIDKSAASKRYVRALRRLKGILVEIPEFLGGDL